VCADFADVDMAFIDEVSMTGCTMIQDVSTKMSDAKSNKDPFGGIDLIFAGDFYQLPPNTNDPLYSEPDLAKNINLTKASAGFLKFQALTHVIILRQQHRMRDPEYKDVVQRFRHGQQLAKDEKYCLGKTINADNTLATGHLSALDKEPIIIVKNNDVRYHINMIKSKQHANAVGTKLLINIAHDVAKSHVPNRVRHEMLLLHETGKTSYTAGLLPMFVGMPVMIKKNIGTELGISNGSTGTIVDIVLDPREVVDYSNDRPHYLRFHPEAVYVEIDTPLDKNGKPTQKFRLKGLPPNVFAMNCKSNGKQRPQLVVHQPKDWPVTVTMSRKQFSFLPAYAITVNSSQGRTLESAIVHLDGDFTNNVKPYVMLSRLTNGKNFGIIGKWRVNMWKTKPCPKMLKFQDKQILVKEQDTLKELASMESCLVDLDKKLRLILQR
jgi:hypothetical protein